MAASGLLRHASAQTLPRAVVLYTVGHHSSGMFRRSLRDALHGLPIALRIESVATVAEVHPSRDALCLIVTLDDEAAHVLRVEPQGEHRLLRRVPLRGRLDASARAAIGHVVRTAVESMIQLRAR